MKETGENNRLIKIKQYIDKNKKEISEYKII